MPLEPTMHLRLKSYRIFTPHITAKQSFISLLNTDPILEQMYVRSESGQVVWIRVPEEEETEEEALDRRKRALGRESAAKEKCEADGQIGSGI